MQNLFEKTWRLLPASILTLLTLLLLNCAGAQIDPTRQIEIFHSDAVCLIIKDQCVFDQGKKKKLLRKGRPPLSKLPTELQGWIVMPQSIYYDLIREFPEEN